MNLNAAQKEAVCHFRGPCMVLAGPGSGKTYTIARRIEYLMKEYKVRPEEILVITFTKYASYEMKKRFAHIMKGRSCPVTFGTFHGIYYGILKWAYGFTSANILSEEDKFKLVGQILQNADFDFEADIEDEQDYIREILTEIGKVKNNRINIDTYESPSQGNVFRDIYRMYESTRKKMKKIDFDDMLVLCYELFCSRPDILKKWQEKFRFILVDEFQDVNKVQYDVLKMLAKPEDNLFVVGDDDQSIYEFRGARPDIMLGFKNDYPGTNEIFLDMNYRSTKNIINGAMRVINNNQLRYKKKIVTGNEKGDCVHVQEVKDAMEESRYVTKKVQELTKENVPLEQIAVLFRTNIDARVLAETFMDCGIPFRMRENIQNIYQHFIARNIKSYFRLALGERDRRDFLDIMNCPKRYISRDSLESSKVTFEDLRKFYCDKAWMQDRIDQFEWDLKMMEGKTPFAQIQYIRKKIGYDDYLKEYAAARKINEEDLFQILSEIEERSRDFKTVGEWFEHVEEYGETLKRIKQQEAKQKEAVSLMTMHGAKGLEFDTVFIVESNEGVIPYKKAKLDKEIEEERRMFYVAMTRAKKRLIISYVKNKNGKELNPSRFVQELLQRI